MTYSKWLVQASKQTSIHTHGCNEVMLVWGLLRLDPIMENVADVMASDVKCNCSIDIVSEIRCLCQLYLLLLTFPLRKMISKAKIHT